MNPPPNKKVSKRSKRVLTCVYLRYGVMINGRYFKWKCRSFFLWIFAWNHCRNCELQGGRSLIFLDPWTDGAVPFHFRKWTEITEIIIELKLWWIKNQWTLSSLIVRDTNGPLRVYHVANLIHINYYLKYYLLFISWKFQIQERTVPRKNILNCNVILISIVAFGEQ